MVTQIDLGGITVDVVRKDIKNLHLSVYPPTGRVRISAPSRMSVDTIRVFAISKLGWIKRQQTKILKQPRDSAREYLDRESHYLWGKRYLLKIVEHDGAPEIELTPRWMVIKVRPETPDIRKQSVLEEWYRGMIKAAVPPLLAKWEAVLGVKVARVFVQHMKTKWGSCSPARGAIRLNTELARKPPDCLEYIVVHEMAHMIVPTHGPRFVELMDLYIPSWRHIRDQLNDLPVRHEDWRH